MVSQSESTVVDVGVDRDGRRDGGTASDGKTAIMDLQPATDEIGSAIEEQTAMVTDVNQAVDDLAEE